jgi:hypothetical protein
MIYSAPQNFVSENSPSADDGGWAGSNLDNRRKE